MNIKEKTVIDIKKQNKDIGSLLQTSKICYLCGATNAVHKHHIFYGVANRKISDEDLMCVYLCPAHHNMSAQGVHFNNELDLKLKKQAEKIWIMTYANGDFDEGIMKFIHRYGKNYLDDEDL